MIQFKNTKTKQYFNKVALELSEDPKKISKFLSKINTIFKTKIISDGNNFTISLTDIKNSL